MATQPRYILITPAKNEEAYIEKTAQSVIRQTILPLRWVIVDDGSTDKTGEIARRFAAQNRFIVIVSVPQGARNFGAKVKAFHTGMKEIAGLEFDYIGNLDADVSFEPNLYERLLSEFEHHPKLGITSGVIYETINNKWSYAHSNPEWCVGGAAQFFRRGCFEEIGGYKPVELGGEDTILEYLAREKGWEVRAIKNLKLFHHKPSLKSNVNELKNNFKMGLQEFQYGASPVFEIAKSTKRMLKQPYVIGGLVRLLGYFWLLMTFSKKSIEPEIARIIARQQRRRLLHDIAEAIRFKRCV
jgi:poly-beta-1,6-N-acetyl-D-glucosamine synthase